MVRVGTGMMRLGIACKGWRADQLLCMGVGSHKGEFGRFERGRRDGRRCIIVNFVSFFEEIFEGHSVCAV